MNALQAIENHPRKLTKRQIKTINLDEIGLGKLFLRLLLKAKKKVQILLPLFS